MEEQQNGPAPSTYMCVRLTTKHPVTEEHPEKLAAHENPEAGIELIRQHVGSVWVFWDVFTVTTQTLASSIF